MIIRIKILVLLIMVPLLSGCSPKEAAPARFRVGQFLFSTQNATITLYDGKKEKTSLKLKYGKLSNYTSLEAKIYFIKVWADGKLLLEKKIGMGCNGRYTLVLTGIPEKNQPVNKKSTMQKLHTIVEGSEGITTNDYLPQLIVQNDFYIAEKNMGKIRVTHLMLGAVPFSLDFMNGKGKKQVSSTAYPKSSETIDVDTGTYDLQVHFDDRPQTEALQKIKIKESVLHSLYVIPALERYLTDPILVMGSSDKVKSL